MENYDDDFSTLKARRPMKWKADVPLDEDATIRRRDSAIGPVEELDDFEDDFADAVLSAVSQQRHIQREPLPDAFLSDSSSKSFGARSAASGTSAMSATSVDTDFGDDDFDGFEDVDAQTLKQRFHLRERRAEAAARCEADGLDGIDVEQLTQRAKAGGTTFKSLRFADPQDELAIFFGASPPSAPHRAPSGQMASSQAPAILRASQSSRMLRGMRSVAQFQHQQQQHQQHESRLRGAVSMLDLQHDGLRVQQRPLTAYKEPSTLRTRPAKAAKLRTHLIRNPQPALRRQEANGMVLNPRTGMWEGNDADASKFDFEPARPRLIPKSAIKAPQDSGMIFDKTSMSWIYANENVYDDPFAEIEDEPQDLPVAASRNVRIESTTSTSSFGRASVARSEASAPEVFDLTTRMVVSWRHEDERFMRKFGRWIGGEDERQDMLYSDQHFYEMVRNA